jgi:bacterial/archaeal transporter family-2 protein
MQQILLMLVAILAGAVLPVQTGLSAKMGETTGSPIIAALLSFLIGTLGMVCYIMVNKIPFSAILAARQAPPMLWISGLLGAFFVTATILIAPRLGIALTFGLVVAGQMIVSLVFDQFGLLGMPVKELSMMRLLGTVLLIVGVILIRKY